MDRQKKEKASRKEPPTMADKEIVEEMKQSNYEQFSSLVRMHLSFELDLNTDEFNLPCHEIIYYDKGKVRNWNRISKKITGCAAGTKTASPPEETKFALSPHLISQLRILKDFLMRSENIVQEGIFRRTGSASRQNELRSIMNQQKKFDLSEGYTVHDCATVFKGCLSELPEPLLSDAHYPAHCQIAELCNTSDTSKSKVNEVRLLNSVQLLLLLLPEDNRVLMKDVIDMLHQTAQHESSNKMSPDSLATLFTPHLICPRNLPAEALHYVSQNMSCVISYMIVKGQYIFDIPPKLATDIRAYSLEQKRKKIMSPEKELDESISDISTVNTVYTFVDREKTAEAHNSNPTDTALAQLYAHIQSLPESSKKRKLIKQFNKENGQGTPLQMLLVNRQKNAGSGRSVKSIGCSIKKHIFQKSLVSRTPQRNFQSAQSDTPNSALTAHKVRVLFPSPNQACKRHPLHKSISSSSLILETGTSPAQKCKAVSVACHSTLHSDQHVADLGILGFTQGRCKNDKSNSKNIKLNESPSDKYFAVNLKMIEKPYELNRKNDILMNKKNCFKRKSESDADLIGLHNRNDYLSNSQPPIRKIVSLDNFYSICTKSRDRNVHCFPKLAYKNALTLGGDQSSEPDKKIDDEITPLSVTPNGEHSYRSKEIITSTPSLLFGRKSMSPITKSTQRMPKSMQESIMTPRSRKPVLLVNTAGLLDSNHPSFEGTLTSFREQDEDSFLNHDSSAQANPHTQCKTYVDEVLSNEITKNHVSNAKRSSQSDSLTSTFREYLLSRSVLTTSPADTSFSSHSDDFGSTPNIRDLNESEMSSSLLYCLDGNIIDSNFSGSSENSSKLIGFGGSLKYRKYRFAKTKELFDEKENHPNEKTYLQSKKVLILEKNPNETSL